MEGEDVQAVDPNVGEQVDDGFGDMGPEDGNENFGMEGMDGDNQGDADWGEEDPGQEAHPGQEGGMGAPDGNPIEYAELVKTEVLGLYRDMCEEAGQEANEAFCAYLEETFDENDALDIVIQGNDKYNFMNRLTDKQLILICQTLERYAIYIEDVDLRYNELTDVGAKALGDLIAKSPRLLGLNLQGNQIKSDGAQYLAEALKNCTNL